MESATQAGSFSETSRYVTVIAINAFDGANVIANRCKFMASAIGTWAEPRLVRQIQRHGRLVDACDHPFDRRSEDGLGQRRG
jgi:hypothetical protein